MTVSKQRRKKRKRRAERRRVFANVEDQSVLFDDSESQPVEIQAAGESDDNTPKFSMVAYTGGPMQPGGWYSSAPLILDVNGMHTVNGQRIPIHRDHDMGRIVGHTTKITTTASQIRLQGVISAKNDPGYGS